MSELHSANGPEDSLLGARRLERPVFAILLFVLVNGAFLAWWFVTSDDISAEAGPIENLQMVFLLSAVLVFVHHGRSEPGVSRHLAFAMSIACLYLLLREMDFRVLPVPEAVRWLSSNVPRKVSQGIVLLVLAVYSIRHMPRLAETLRAMRLRHVWPYLLSGFLFAAAKLAEEISRADKNPIGNFALPHGQFWEEMLELNADLMLLVAAVGYYAVRRMFAR